MNVYIDVEGIIGYFIKLLGLHKTIDEETKKALTKSIIAKLKTQQGVHKYIDNAITHALLKDMVKLLKNEDLYHE